MNNDEKQLEAQASETQEVEETTEAAETEQVAETTSDVDYQKELEMARKELEKKDKRIGQAEHVIEKLKEEGSKVNQENIEEMVNRLVEEKVNRLTEQVRGDAIDSIILQYSSNEDEAKLIKFHLENSIKQSGDDVTDILNAKALANKARFAQKSSEIQRAKAETEASKATSAGQKSESGSKLQLSAADKRLMQVYGLTKEDIEKGVR